MPNVKLVLCQDSAFDNFANLALQLEREGIAVEFIWPWHEGPLQGSPEKASRLLKLHNQSWNLRRFRSSLSWGMFALFSKVLKYKFFIQTPYLEDHYHPRTTQLFSGKTIGYINYGVNLEARMSTNFDLEIFQQFSPMLLANREEFEEFIARGAVPANLVVTGMPGPYEVFLQSQGADLAQKAGTRPTLLWAPHWIQDWATWEEVIPELLNFALAFEDIRILIRAHPLLTDISHKKLPDGYTKFEAKLEYTRKNLDKLLSLRNVEVSDGTMVNDCLQSDWLLTDGISIIAYWASTGRPFAVTRKPDSPEFSEPGRRLVGHSETIYVNRPGQTFDWLSKKAKQLRSVGEGGIRDQGMISEAKNWFSEGESPGSIFATWLQRRDDRALKLNQR